MKYEEWHANSADSGDRGGDHGDDHSHYYGWASISNTFRRDANEERSGAKFDFIGRDLASMTREAAPAVMQPWPEKMQWNGIDCRFGWAGFNSEAHYDFKRNFVAMVALPRTRHRRHSPGCHLSLASISFT